MGLRLRNNALGIERKATKNIFRLFSVLNSKLDGTIYQETKKCLLGCFFLCTLTLGSVISSHFVPVHHCGMRVFPATPPSGAPW